MILSNLHLKTCAKNGDRNKVPVRSVPVRAISSSQNNGLEIPIKAARSSIWKLGDLSPFIKAVVHH